VIGANGGIGRHLVAYLRCQPDAEVSTVSRSRTDEPNSFECDLLSETAVSQLFLTTRPAIIFNLAGSFSGDFKTDLQANVASTQVLLDATVKLKRPHRIILFGSAAEYGSVSKEDNPISEEYPCQPVSVYGLTKYMQTNLAQFYIRTQNLDIVIARLFNIAAPGLSEKLFFGRAEQLIRQYQRGEIKSLEFGNLDAVRDYATTESVLEQVLAIAKFGRAGEIYNIGSGKPQTMREILLQLLAKEKIGAHSFSEKLDNPDIQRSANVSHIVADVSKTKRLLEQLKAI
jgi:GDP-4-dehydro-6-deoxy-D-mannose reductase